MTNSKFAILDKDDNLYLIGVFTKEDNLAFSNSHYKPYSYAYKYSGTSKYYDRVYGDLYKYYDV